MKRECEETDTLDIEHRKNEHLDLCLNEDVAARTTTGLNEYGFIHNAVPDVDFRLIDTNAFFARRRVPTPFLMSSMTGGTTRSGEINRRLAFMAERHGWVMALGSTRAAMEREAARESYQVRTLCPSVPLVANFGAVQLNYGYGVDHCRKIVQLVEADALVLHLNSMQEVFQPEGDVNFAGLLDKIAEVCAALEVPVGVKEVGFGIDGRTARKLVDAGVSFVDVAGAGGTSWIQVERLRGNDAMRRRAGAAFRDWGTPTATCIVDVRREVPRLPVVASGGMQTGVDAAKALALGADLVGFARTALLRAAESDEELDLWMQTAAFELRATMFGIGAQDLAELRRTDRIVKR